MPEEAEEHDDASSSLAMALADIEMIRSAYPDETKFDPSSLSVSRCNFPLHVDLWFSESAMCTLEFQDGYPTTTTLNVASYRTKNAAENIKVERAVAAIRRIARENEGMECGLACCAAAMDAWNDSDDHLALEISADPPTDEHSERQQQQQQQSSKFSHGSDTFSNTSSATTFSWMSGPPLVDRKSTFVAHVCPIASEADVKPALQQLISGSTRIQRATHNMYAYRLTEYIPSKDGKNFRIPIKKHDNDDDGEEGAGTRLAQLLELRKDDGVLVVVSRWYGGIPLGPKRFAHIVNVARELLVQHAAAHPPPTNS